MSKKKSSPGHLTAKHKMEHPAMRRNLCFACGKDNPHGMHLRFVYDEESDTFLCRFRLANRFWGPPKHAHGGIIATILDEAMGKVNKRRHVIALTSKMEVQYLKPVPLRKPLTVESWESSVRGRRHVNVAEIRDAKGGVLAKGRALFIAVDPHRMFAQYLKKSR